MTHSENLCHPDQHVQVSGGVACCLALHPAISPPIFTIGRYVDDDVDSSSVISRKMEFIQVVLYKSSIVNLRVLDGCRNHM